MNETKYTMTQFIISVSALVLLFLLGAHIDYLSTLY